MLLHKTVEHDSRVRHEAEALSEAGHQVTVVHLPRTPGELEGPLDGFEVLSATPPQWVRRRLPFYLYRLVFLASFVSAVRSLRPDVVHAHDAAMLAPGYIGARLSGAELVYDSHELATGVHYRDRGWALLVRALERTFIRRCAGVITVSDGIADRLRETYGLSRRPSVVRNLPATPEGPSARVDLRDELGLADDDRLLLHLGAVATDRGCEAAVRAMAHVQAHLLFLGADDNAYAERLGWIAAECGVADRVHLRGSVAVDRIRAYTEQADAGLSLLEDTCENHRQALPNKVFEYIAARTPVVVSDLPELRRLVCDHRVGWTVDPSDSEALPAVLTEALAGAADPNLKRSIGEAGASLTWEREARRFVADYPGAASPASGRPRALVFVRNAVTHDARVLREARLLAGLGYDTEVVGVVSSAEGERRASIDGLSVRRLAPTPPFGWLRRFRGSRVPAGSEGGATPGARGGATSLARRVHRWLVTLDYYRRGMVLVRRKRPELVHCNDYNTMWIGVAAKLAGSRVVYDAHELWPDRNLRPEPRWWLLACEALFVRVADHNVTTSPGYAAVMARRYRTPAPAVVRNVPDGLEPARAGGRPERLAVYFGAVTYGRGLEAAIAALPHVDRLRLRIVGPDAWGYRERLRAFAKQTGVEDRVEFVAPVSPGGAPAVLADAAVGLALIEPICLSYRLTLPNKLFEYTALGIPILGSDMPLIEKFIVDEGVGRVARPGNPLEIARELSSMLEPATNEALRRAAREAGERLRWESERAPLVRAYGGSQGGGLAPL